MKKSILRFTPSERWLHNVVMFSFVLLLVTGLSITYFNQIGDSREAREFLRAVHLGVAILFVAGPFLILLFSRKKVWRENIGVVFRYRWDDFLWLVKTPFMVFKKDLFLPPQDKFNGGQKIWIWTALSASLTLAVTGVMLWLNPSAIIALFIHTGVSLLMIPALSGHIYMAIINKESRPGLTSIIDGEVDATWAQEHHPLWMDRHAKERIKEVAER